MTSKKEIKPNDVCYFKISPTSVDYHVNGMFITVRERKIVNTLPCWTYEPPIYSPRLKANFDFAIEATLVPIAGPTVDDVKDTLEVLQMGNSATFDAMRELGKKVKTEHYEDGKA